MTTGNKDAYQMKVNMLNSSSNNNNNNNVHHQQIINCNTSKVQLSPRSIGKLHQNLHSQQAYGRKSPLVATTGMNIASIKDSRVVASTGVAVQAVALNGSLDNCTSINNRFNGLNSGGLQTSN